MLDHNPRQSSAQTKSLQRTIDYDPLRDSHLKRYFRAPFMQEHMRHAAALDRVSDKRNPWNDAVEYLMEAGSAYNVRGLFQHHQNNVEIDAKLMPSPARQRKNNSNNNNKRPTTASSATSSTSMPLRPHPPPSTGNSVSSSMRPRQPSLSYGATVEHYRNVSGRAIRGEGSLRGSGYRQINDENNNNNNNKTGSPPLPPPLPRYRAALKNIRQFDEEVSRILAEGSQMEADKRDHDRWKRTQQRLKVERMIQNANSPKFGRRRVGDDEGEQLHDDSDRRRDANENDEKESSTNDTNNNNNHRHHSRPRSLASRRQDDDYHRSYNDNNNNNKNKEISLQCKNQNNGNHRPSSSSASSARGPDRIIPGWVSFAISRFQANCVGWVVRNKLQRARDAAVKIQRLFREHLAGRGVNLAVRILQKLGRGMKVRRRIFLLGERHRLYEEVIRDHRDVTIACLRLHTAGAVAAKWPVVEAYEREQIVEDYLQSVEDHHFTIIGNELKRRAQLICVKPQGKLSRETDRRLMDDEDDEGEVARRVGAMKPMETPSVLVGVLQEIEAEEPELRGTKDDHDEKTEQERKKKDIMNDTIIPVPRSSSGQREDGNNGEDQLIDDAQEENDRRHDDVNTTILPVNNNDVEEL